MNSKHFIPDPRDYSWGLERVGKPTKHSITVDHSSDDSEQLSNKRKLRRKQMAAWIGRGILAGFLWWFMPWDSHENDSHPGDVADCERSHEC
jgi:hypothetical protein